MYKCFGNIEFRICMKTLNFDEFEEIFKMGVNVVPDSDNRINVVPELNSTPTNTLKKHIMLLDNKRIRNVAITRRKLAMEPNDLTKAINHFDLKSLDLENVEILLHILPTAEEVKIFKDYETKHKSLEELSSEDRFMIQLSKIERLSQKLNVMSLMGNFEDTVNLLNPGLTIIMAASKSVKNAENFQKILELILAFGNYMNSAKRGAAYGFKLQSLETLIFLKAPASKNFTLLHYLDLVIRNHYPDLVNFAVQEFKFVDKAATISLETIVVDFSELEKSMELAKKECSLRGNDTPPSLSLFVQNADFKCNEVKKNMKIAQDSYKDCVEFYGESPKTSTTTFFTILSNFAKQFQQVDEENLARQKLEMSQNVRNSIRTPKGGKEDVKNKQAAVLEELSNKNRNRKRELNEIGVGAVDDMISDITRQPYIDDTAPKRQKSFRDNQQKPPLIVARRKSEKQETII